MSTAGDILVPDIGGAGEVDVIEVLVKPGDRIKVDTPLVTLESDKATMEVPSTAEGVVKELKVRVGDKLTQGAVILTLDSADDKATPKSPPDSGKKTAPPEATPSGKSQPDLAKGATSSERIPLTSANMTSSSVVASAQSGERKESADIHAGPAVRKLARELGVELSEVHATGPKQRILKEDIEGYVKSRLADIRTQGGGGALPAAPTVDFASFGPVEVEPLSRLRKLSGRNLQRNWLLAPHVTQHGEADITQLEDFRRQQKQALEKQNIRLTPIVFILKAVVAALKKYPQFNASLDASGEKLVLKKYFHIGVAVDTPEGLVVPVIRDVDQKGLLQLAGELADLSEKARKKQLLPRDMQGGCFSISSLGGIGGTSFTPIINLPEVAILGVSKAAVRPVFHEGVFVPRTLLPLSLSYDHRVIDGADGARFIVYLAELLSDIRNMLL